MKGHQYVRTTIWLTKEQKKFLKKSGNASEFVRSLIVAEGLRNILKKL